MIRDWVVLVCLGLVFGVYVALVSAGTVANSCSDSDGGLAYYVAGYVYGYYKNSFYNHTDYCKGSDLMEFHCSRNSKHRTWYTCPHGCAAGSCLGQPPNTTAGSTQQSCHCYDSDGGLNYYVAGNVSGYCNGTFGKRDYCQDSTKLIEFFCARDGNGYSDTETCPNGCANGRCLNASSTGQATTVWCSDTDGGINYMVKGTVSGRYSNGQNYSKQDYCNRTVLTEYYCMGITMKQTTNTCTSGCSDGRCRTSNAGPRAKPI